MGAKRRDFLLNRRRLGICVFLPTILIAMIAFGLVRSRTGHVVIAKTKGPKPTLASASRSIQRERVQVELVTIRPTGFDPAEIRRAPGPFLLAVDNRSGRDTVMLRLTRERGSSVREVRLARGQLKWREKIDLPPGDYSLAEANHANWLCKITIAP
jgi:hypothetical protein